MSRDEYQLLDSGSGRKLEQIGPYRLIRPCAHAIWRRTDPAAWKEADLTFTRVPGGEGSWRRSGRPLPEQWPVRIGGLSFHIRTTEFGHLGIFPEQTDNWNRLDELIRAGLTDRDEFRLLNLFAYTGGSTFAAARAGARVVHVDASKTTVRWARENAELGGLADLPVRWITEDVQKFVTREIRRGQTYQAIVLDPPSFGRGTRGELWKIEEHLTRFVDQLGEILDDDWRFVLLSCHTAGFTGRVLANVIEGLLGRKGVRYELGEMANQEALGGRLLPNGTFCLAIRERIDG